VTYNVFCGTLSLTQSIVSAAVAVFFVKLTESATAVRSSFSNATSTHGLQVPRPETKSQRLGNPPTVGRWKSRRPSKQFCWHWKSSHGHLTFSFLLIGRHLKGQTTPPSFHACTRRWSYLFCRSDVDHSCLRCESPEGTWHEVHGNRYFKSGDSSVFVMTFPRMLACLPVVTHVEHHFQPQRCSLRSHRVAPPELVKHYHSASVRT